MQVVSCTDNVFRGLCTAILTRCELHQAFFNFQTYLKATFSCLYFSFSYLVRVRNSIRLFQLVSSGLCTKITLLTFFQLFDILNLPLISINSFDKWKYLGKYDCVFIRIKVNVNSTESISSSIFDNVTF